MKKSTRVLFGLAGIVSTLLASCAVLTPGLIGHENFEANAPQMQVDGRFGWTNNKIVSFGPYYTSAFHTGHTLINDNAPEGWHFNLFEADYSNALQRFSFKQFDSAGTELEVLCLAQRSSKTIHYNKTLDAEQVLGENYRIVMYQDNREYSVNYSTDVDALSTISFGPDTFTISNERSHDRNAQKIFSGIVIKESAEVVAAVDLTRKGIVWIRSDLDSMRKVRLAALATAILVRPKLENAQ
jgi:hypothetical protein